MKRKKKTSFGKLLIIRVIAHIFLLGIAIYISLPVLRVIQLSIQPPETYFTLERSLLSQSITFDNFVKLFADTKYPRWLFNSILIASLQTLITCAVCMLAAYGYTVYSFRAKEKLFLFMLSTVMIPGAVAVPALFTFFKVLNLLNTYLAVVFPGVASVFGLFFMRSYMATAVARELVDAGRIDGASELGIFYKIILPTLKPGLAALAILVFTGSFNDFFWPMIVLRTEDMYTVQVGLPTWNVIIGAAKIRYDLLAAGSVVSTIPPLLIFIFFQRYLISGLTFGVLKK
ncbi:MAG: carbohydrate ABC transporter permease [Thermosphaera sp.]